MEEVWKDIPGWEGYYQVSDMGNVRSIDRVITNIKGFKRPLKGAPLKFFSNHRGYQLASFSRPGLRKKYQVHRLVMMSFVGDNPNLCVDHRNFVKDDNRLENLEYVTNRENSRRYSVSTKFTSKHVGVHWDKLKRKWVTQISINGQAFKLGEFDDEELAAKAYQSKLQSITAVQSA